MEALGSNKSEFFCLRSRLERSFNTNNLKRREWTLVNRCVKMRRNLVSTFSFTVPRQEFYGS